MCKKHGGGFRYVQTVLLFLGMVLCSTMRVNMSLAIVDMTDEQRAGHFPWSEKKQSVVLSSFFWGYVVLQVPAGELSKKYGGKLMVLITVVVSSVMALALPGAAYIGDWILVCVCRIMQGLAQGLIFPTMHYLVAQWIPFEEKGILTTFIYSGTQLGIALELVTAGFIASLWGWQAIFYVNGTIGCLWSIVYIFLGADSPDKSKYINQEEVRYIETSLGRKGALKKYPTPWLKMFSSIPFWAVIISHCGQNWGYFTLMTEMPTYMARVLQVDLKSNGELSALPYLAMHLLSYPFGAMSDLITRKKWLSIINTRKLFNSIGLWGAGLALIGLSYSPPGNVPIAVLMLTIAVGLNSGHYLGFLLVHIDMAPNFCGYMMGISNGASNILSIIAPLVCGAVVKDDKDQAEWRKVFFIAAGVYFFANLIFLIFATSERQSWNEPEGVQDAESRAPDQTKR